MSVADIIKELHNFALNYQSVSHVRKKVFLNGPTLASFSFIFGLFKQTTQFLQQSNVKKCHVHPVYGAGIQTQNMSCLP